MRLALLLLALCISNVNAQTYPSKPVKLIVPFPAGSATDQVARVIGAELQAALGQPFVVENKPGAQGSIAATEVARAAPDGYTLMVGTNTPLAANPGKLSAGYGSAGSQVSQAMLRSMGRIDFIDVPYKGLPQAITDVLGGQISFTFADLANALAQIKGGKLRGIAVTSAKRSALAPDVPAIAEELSGYELIAWFALVAPAGTPAPVVARLHEITAASLAKPEVAARFAALGTDVAPMNPEQLAGFIRSEIVKFGRLAKEAGIQPE
jgi:tripartite-type tricarboxylate transporter receptor subunit TctC